MFVTFIDDCSRKLWVYVLKTKDQVLEKFKEFYVLVERQSSKKLKCIHIDNGGKYCGPFDVYCKQHGIKYEKNPPKNPLQEKLKFHTDYYIRINIRM